MNLEEFREALALYVTGALDDEERTEVERELAARGDSGAAELRAVEALFGELAQAVPQQKAPAGLRDELVRAAAPRKPRCGMAPPSTRCRTWRCHRRERGGTRPERVEPT